MAQAANTNQVLSQAAPLAAVGSDCSHTSLWTAVTAGTFLQWQTISTNPAALVLGERFEIAAGALVIEQPAGTNESEDQARRAVRGRILGGVWVQYHTGSPGNDGTSNVIATIARTAIAVSAFTVT